MNILSALFNKKSDGRGTHKVRITDATIAQPLDEDRPRHVNAGEEITVSAAEYEQLLIAGKAKSLQYNPSGAEQAKKPKIEEAKLTRPRVERQEPPESVRELGDLFVTAWKLEHECACRVQELKLARYQAQSLGLVVGLEAIRREKKTHRLQRFVISCEEAVREFDWARMYRARLACGDLLLAEVNEIAALKDEIRETAFMAFSERLAPLGLHRDKARSLFPGSVLYLKFCSGLPAVSEGRRCFKGGAEMHATYSDEPFPAIMSYYRHARSCRPGLEKLLKEARVELATAKKAMRAIA